MALTITSKHVPLIVDSEEGWRLIERRKREALRQHEGEGPGRAPEAAPVGQAEGPQGPQRSEAHILDNILHITTTNLNDNPSLCEIYDRVCIGRPCDTRSGRCPYNSSSAIPNNAYPKRNKQKSRAYWAINSANAFYSDKMAWWLTLTNTPTSRPVEESWNVLRTYIKRTTRRDMCSWVCDKNRPDYSLKEERLVMNYYSDYLDDLDRPVDFHYIAIKTSEGYGVYHEFIYGDMLPVSWLRYHWEKITGAKQIRIEKIKSMAPVQRYALNQYAVGQDQFVRFSMSRDLLFPSARDVWKKTYQTYGYEDGLKLWCYSMMVHGIPDAGQLGIPTLDTWLKLRNDKKELYRFVSLREALEYYDKYPSDAPKIKKNPATPDN